LPLVGLEALAAGTPFVAAAVRGVRELLTDGENALLVAPDDPKALAAAIGRVLDDDDLRQRLRAGGLRLVAAHGTGAMVDAYLRLYERVAR
jgi:glycosyltransferase involved in cell wall biosynthesis